MKLTVGTTLASAVDGATVIVVRAGDDDVELTSGGLAMYDPKSDEAPQGEPDGSQLGGVQIGKRYVTEADDVELLATKPGKGTLAIDGVALRLRDAKPLPASD
ncbi:hypothetical protein ACFY2Y_13160 [Janibacter hoylei]|uniref:Uncharacterized protein n=1 Tax=Janibacter indicus TaxID=857417 RepID=A0A1L3MJA8_9MICO|nr:hypothetical protein [Janibacter indicus]APH02411.1 hypothetical protein ASJ30_13450 [Janibacter indicus]